MIEIINSKNKLKEKYYVLVRFRVECKTCGKISYKTFNIPYRYLIIKGKSIELSFLQLCISIGQEILEHPERYCDNNCYYKNFLNDFLKEYKYRYIPNYTNYKRNKYEYNLILPASAKTCPYCNYYTVTQHRDNCYCTRCRRNFIDTGYYDDLYSNDDDLVSFNLNDYIKNRTIK